MRPMMRWEDVEKELNMSRSTIKRRMKDDETFPKPVDMGGNMRAWHREEIENWKASRPKRD